MELRHLRYFVAVGEEQNITRAAARLHVSQPPLSRQIRDLESELGVALFERSARAVRLTAAGRMFLPEAQAVLRRAEEAVEAVKAAAGGNRGVVHVAYAPSLTVEILPRALRLFQSQMPAARVILHDLSTEEMLEGLRDGKLDLALMIEPGQKALGTARTGSPLPAEARAGNPAAVDTKPVAQRTGRQSWLIFEELHRYPLCLAASPAHPLARVRKVRLEHLVSERLIAYSKADYPEYHDRLISLFKPFNQLPQIAEEHDSSTSLIAAVEAGRGVALVPASLGCLAGPRLRLRGVIPEPTPLVVGVARKKGPSSKLLDAFIAAARACRP